MSGPVNKILVVEDDLGVRAIVKEILSREGMQAVAVGDGEEALERLRRSGPFDALVLDLMLPGKMDGFSVCREVRRGLAGKTNTDLPVVMLTARDDETSVVVGLEVGADDYVTKPFKPRELVSRLRAHLRRRSMDSRRPITENDRLVFPGLEIDLYGHRVLADGEEVELTAKQFDVLSLLASCPGRVYSRQQIMDHLWGGVFFGHVKAADVHIQHVRKKIEPDPKNPLYIQTVRGIGYKFSADLVGESSSANGSTS